MRGSARIRRRRSSPSRAVRVLLHETPADNDEPETGATVEFSTSCPPRRRGESESIGFEAVAVAIGEILSSGVGGGRRR